MLRRWGRCATLALATQALLVPWPGRGEIPPHPRDLQFEQAVLRLPRPDGRRVQLASGPVVYLAEDHTLPLVEITVGLRVGDFLDPPEKIGTASLTGALLRRGGSRSVSAERLDERVDDLGAHLESSTGVTRGGASLSVPTWVLREGLELLFEILAEPSFQPDRLTSARSSLMESMRRRNEEPLAVLQREWDRLLFGDRHFSTRLMTPTTLNAVGRSDLLDFHRRYWRPPHMIVAVSGDFDPSRLLADLEAGFDRWTNATPAGQRAFSPPA
jgi:zinc protease